MKILWIVNTLFPYPAEKMNREKTVYGGWLNSLMNSLNKSEEIKNLGIATFYNGDKLLKFVDKKIIYYVIPVKDANKYDKNSELFWKDVVNDFNPDLIHIHGTEYPFSLSCINACPNQKYCVSIQGLVSVCGQKKVYTAGIETNDILKNITFRDCLKFDFLFNQHKKMLKRAKYEKEILQKVNIVIGRTSWDYAYTENINGNRKYYKCNESLRDSFYNNNWDYNNIEKNSIFMSQISYPLKGFHVMLKAMPKLIKEYPNLKVYIAGNNILETKNIFDKIKFSGYAKYLKTLIKKYNLNKHICFTGLLNEEELCNALKKCNLFVQTSSIENSSNSLGEAMLIGMPIVASFVGGTPDMIKDKEEGLLYPFGDEVLLSKYIKDIFENIDDAILMGKKAQEHAKKTHNINNNTKNIINIYKNIL